MNVYRMTVEHQPDAVWEIDADTPEQALIELTGSEGWEQLDTVRWQAENADEIWAVRAKH